MGDAWLCHKPDLRVPYLTLPPSAPPPPPPTGGQAAQPDQRVPYLTLPPAIPPPPPYRAVDAHVGRHLFDECICGLLRDKTRILVTHQLQVRALAGH